VSRVETTAATGSTSRPRALDEPTLSAAFCRTAAERGDAVALRTPGGDVEVTWREYAARAADYAAGLAGLGVGAGDPVAIMLTNRPEFHLVDCGAMHLRAVPFSVYNTSSPEQLEYLLGDAGNRVVICERTFLDRVLAARAACPAVEHVIVVDGEGEADTLTLEDLVARGAPGFDAEAAVRAVAPDDLLTLIYTSGTTGPPKGVQITHANMLAEWRALHAGSPVAPHGRLISFLPAAHIADRWSSHYGSMVFGHEVTCCPDPRRVMEIVPEVRPTTFGAVPRIWEKTKAALEAAFAAEPDENRRAAVRWALEVGLRRVRAEQAGQPVDDALAEEHARADELVLSKLRESLGLDQADRFVAGAAPTPAEVLEFFAAIGIGICESWGMSELTSLATINPPERIKIGTVGPPLPGIELRLAEDGEVLVRGGIVMPGYRNQPDRTAETIDADGWLHSGDIGTLDEDGYLTIVDRKKELIINAAGKNMSPANIEAALKTASPLIGQACVIGDRRPYNVALIVLDPDGTAAFAAAHEVGDEALGAVAEAGAIVEAVEEGVRRANERLARVEQIKRFRILEGEWDPGGDELTPTMKLKRRPIAEKYADEIEALYTES
jgi:long-chain acyl-CoA synthetase